MLAVSFGLLFLSQKYAVPLHNVAFLWASNEVTVFVVERMEECEPGKRYPYPKSPPPTITENITYPFDDLEHFEPWEVSLKIIAYTIAMAMATIGNVLIMLTIILNRHGVFSSSMVLYMANLATSDFMVGSLVMWVHLVTGINQEWPFGEIQCKVYHFLQIVFLFASVFFMTAIAVDRLLATVYPLKWRLIKFRVHVIIAVIAWLLAVAAGVPVLLVRLQLELIWADRHQVWCDERWPRYATHTQSNHSLKCQFYYPNRQTYYNCQVVLMYFIPILIMTIAYSIILYKLNDRKTPGEQTDTALLQQRLVYRRVIRTLVAVLVAFVVCWTPQQIYVFLDANWPDRTLQLSADVRFLLIYIAHFSSALNPIIYAGLHENFRTGFKEIICARILRQRRKIAPAKVEKINNAEIYNGSRTVNRRSADDHLTTE